MVPESIAKKMRSDCTVVEADFYKSVSILFVDIPGFSQLAKDYNPSDLVGFLNSFYVSLDERIGNYDVYKVETVNDCYMVASGERVYTIIEPRHEKTCLRCFRPSNKHKQAYSTTEAS